MILCVTDVINSLSKTLVGKPFLLFHKKAGFARQICGAFVLPVAATTARDWRWPMLLNPSYSSSCIFEPAC
jgi:hypothetical protein